MEKTGGQLRPVGVQMCGNAYCAEQVITRKGNKSDLSLPSIVLDLIVDVTTPQVAVKSIRLPVTDHSEHNTVAIIMR